ncbi:hypothetical protein MHM582_2066 [Microbacterium sp. HM58-2]|nr:hypothetical protein MHM582_2066 [Microbacterium sp. HM58-2]
MSDPTTHEFLPVAGHEDDDECTYREDGTEATYCGATEDEHWVDPEECPACDTPLDECPYPEGACCEDCNHASNYGAVRTPPGDVEIRSHDA